MNLFTRNAITVLTGFWSYWAKSDGTEGRISFENLLLLLPGGGETTVGVGGDYTTLKAAIDAGEHNLIFISDTLEADNITFTALERYIINLDGFSLDMVNFKLLGSTAYLNLFDGIIKTAFTAVSNGLHEQGEGYLFAYKITYNNLTTSANTYISEYGIFDSCIFLLPNIQYGGLGLTSFDFKGQTRNCILTGGGSSSNRGIYALSGYNYHYNLTVNGTFQNNDIIFLDTYGDIFGLIFKANTGRIRCNRATNFKEISGIMDLSCAYGVNLEFSIFTFNSFVKSITNCFQTTSTTLTLSSDDILIVNCRMKIGTISGDRNKINNTIFIDFTGITGDKNSIVGCDWETGAFKIWSTADKTIFTNNRTVGAITDDGTNSIVTNNQLN